MRSDILKETKAYIKELKIPGITKTLNERVKEAYMLDISYEEFIRDLFREAYDIRKENGKKNRIRNANFPYKKYLEDINVEFLPKEAKKKFKELKTLEFIKEGRNIILAGNPGTGKIHMSIGLGIDACNKGYKVYFTTVPLLINELKESRSEKRLKSFEKKFEK